MASKPVDTKSIDIKPPASFSPLKKANLKAEAKSGSEDSTQNDLLAKLAKRANLANQSGPSEIDQKLKIAKEEPQKVEIATKPAAKPTPKPTPKPAPIKNPPEDIGLPKTPSKEDPSAILAKQKPKPAAVKLPPIDVAPPKIVAPKLPPIDAAPPKLPSFDNIPAPKLSPMDSPNLSDTTSKNKGKSPRTSATVLPSSVELSPEYAALKEELLAAFRQELQQAREDILAAIRN